MRGFDPLSPLKRRLQQDNDAMEAAVAMFQNGGAKGVLYNETYTDLTPEQATQIKGVIDRKINNKDMKAAVASLQGKWGYLDIGKDSVDMELLKSQQVTLERISLALGIDPDVLIAGQSFSNKEWAQKKFVTDLVMPMCNSLRDELNRVLVPAFKNGVVDFDFMRDGYFTELKEAEILTNRLGLAQQMEPYVGKYYSHQYMRTKVLHQSEEEIEQIDKELLDEHEADMKLQQAQNDAGMNPDPMAAGQQDQGEQPPAAQQ